MQQGVIYGLLGPNGAGKSTTMNILTGYISATGGTVTIDGHDVLEEPGEARACIGYLPEQPPLYPDMTVEEYLRFAAELKGVRRAERTSQVEKAMARTGLESVGRRLIRNLSKGYKQRVGLAGALMGSPKVIILDEPTVGLDPAQMIEIRALIRDLGRTHTVILSSHIPVSYTHLDVYKRQLRDSGEGGRGTAGQAAETCGRHGNLSYSVLTETPAKGYSISNRIHKNFGGRSRMSVCYNSKHLEQFVKDSEFAALYPQVETAHRLLETKTGPGNDFLGWVSLPKDRCV